MNDNKKIAANTIILYVRLLIVTAIGLYTTRIVLDALGVEDYGLYSVVGGVVTMMNFIGVTMVATSYRFIAVEMGKGAHGNVNGIFNSVFIIHAALSLLLLILGETIGVWYIKTYLNVAVEKIPDALFVLHLSIIATMLSVLTVPYQGLITAVEKFLYMSVIDIAKTFIKLGLVFMLMVYGGNKLRAYSVLMLSLNAFVLISYFVFSWRNFKSAVLFSFNSKINDYKQIFNFAWWILFGAIASIGSRQGAAIIINLFFGTILNAAFGVASQVHNMVMNFVKNLNQAAVPQIMKSYSSGSQERSIGLVYTVSRLTFLIMLIPSVIIFTSIDYILELWLKTVPAYTKEFIVLMMINGLINCFGAGIDAAIQATGNIRKTHLWYAFITLATLPFTYLSFKYGLPPYYFTIWAIVATLVNLVVQLKIVASLTQFNISRYLKSTVMPSAYVSFLIVPFFLIYQLIPKDGVYILIFTFIVTVYSLIIIVFIGLNLSERLILEKRMKGMFKRA
ncbi:Na+-driven multidrug efflux pump [Lentimicrobium saccharophilum]|uniref:Na+-driven multidrug efflux pump n=1 Tax=Lentimicrobium saccharophilum TaxID=1678841 RepID=A0A0S7BXP8_9BACT|nr:hypothetical protein [Lentimicrobium saccharophilum]GAP42353.1 Na+-driven multidrug efflux pump [Lentimicrobium saccharophilum]